MGGKYAECKEVAKSLYWSLSKEQRCECISLDSGDSGNGGNTGYVVVVVMLVVVVIVVMVLNMVKEVVVHNIDNSGIR